MVDWLVANWRDVIEMIAAIIGAASVIVRITPTLKDDNILLPIVKFIGKFIALDKYAPTTRPK